MEYNINILHKVTDLTKPKTKRYMCDVHYRVNV